MIKRGNIVRIDGALTVASVPYRQSSVSVLREQKLTSEKDMVVIFAIPVFEHVAHLPGIGDTLVVGSLEAFVYVLLPIGSPDVRDFTFVLESQIKDRKLNG